MLLIFAVILIATYHQIEGVTIEYPSNEHIEERQRKDLDSIDPIFRHYIVPREIQYHADALKDRLPYFLQCKGSHKSLQLIVPPGANEHLSLDTDYASFTVTATLRRNQYRLELVGRYTCSEMINDRKVETSAYIFIQDGTSVFTKRLYPKVLKQTGIHFFNIPCQTTTWYPSLTCPQINDPDRCSPRPCSARERLINELKCSLPICPNQPICIPVYYQPEDLQPSKIFFDPQIGFALENPVIPNSLNEFSCKSNYTSSQASKVPFDSFDPEFIEIHQPSLTVLPEETVRLSCEIQYGTKVDRKIPTLFWFEDIYGLRLVANETEKAAFMPQKQTYSRNSSITLRGFKANKSYRFYCVRVSDQGIYSRSVDINCVDAPSVELDVTSSGSETIEPVNYGSDSTFYISFFTIPRSKVILELYRNGILVNNDKRFELTQTRDAENQFYEYNLVIYNTTFEDETDLKIIAKSSVLEKSVTIKPIVQGNPVGQLSFIPTQIPRAIPWRPEALKNRANIYAQGIREGESYRVVCNIRHRADVEQPLNVFIQHEPCSVDHCLSDTIDKTCRSSYNQRLAISQGTRINNFQTQFVSVDSQTLDDPAIGHQYICCYESKGTVILAKALVALARTSDMFIVQKPEFSLVTGDVLTYRCEGHDLIYDDLRMIYNDGLSTYERNRFDAEWRRLGTNQATQIDIDWLAPTSEHIRDTSIEVKTPPLRKIGKNGFLQCIALSKRPDVFPHMNDTYVINVEDPVPLRFKNNLSSTVRIDRKAGANVEFDCSYHGRPQPRISWLKGKAPWILDESTLQLRENNGSIFIARAQASDTGFYTCELYNGRDPIIRRSFDLNVKGPNLHPRFRRYTAIFISVSACLILLLLILLIIVAVKYFQMRRLVQRSIFHNQQSVGPVDESEPPMKQLTRLPLPDNFASSNQVKTLLGYVNGTITPNTEDDFKVLGKGQYGVVYQVRLPDVGRVAAKLLPESIRAGETPSGKRKKKSKDEEGQQMIDPNQKQKKEKAAEMLIDELKVMNKAGKHVNIVSLLKVAYPETRFRYLLTGGLIRDEDSFYLMELCSNGSLESMLKRFLQPSDNDAPNKLSLYETLRKQAVPNMTVQQAHDLCQLTVDDLTLIAYQVASGVDYLNRRQIAHCDIATRNVLVNDRFIMKICDFGLATWTTYKNYSEQLARHESVQLEKKNNELATHNLTPELARAFLHASTPDERLLLNKSSIKADVWSFGIFLWTLFLKCRIRPFERLSNEVRNRSDGESFFRRLAVIVSQGNVLHYIDYHEEIPEKIYGIIRECLTGEDDRPEMTRVKAYLCHSEMLSRQAFEYYRTEYNRYQESIAADGNVLRFGEEQGVTNLPTFSAEAQADANRQRLNAANSQGVTFRPPVNDSYYPAASDTTAQTFLSYSDQDYAQQGDDSYLAPIKPNPPRTIAGRAADEIVPLIDTNRNSAEREVPNVAVRGRGSHRPPPPPPTTRPDIRDDSYL